MAQQGTFWSTFAVRFGGSSAIEEILDKDNYTLEELLDHDDVIQECKYLNSNLVAYLSQKEVVEQLIKYVIQKPPAEDGAGAGSTESEDDDDREATKYPYVASELFACEVVSMLECMFDHPELLDLLFTFLDREAPIDPSSAGYFRKVVVVLIQKKYQQLVEYIQGRGIVEKLVRHIGLYSIMELLIMIGWDDGLGQVNDVQWLYKEKLIPMLVARLDPAFEKDEEVHVNAARALVDVVVKCPPSASSLLVTHLQSAPMLDKVFTYMLSGSLSSLNNCLSVVIVLVQRDANRRSEFPFGELDSLAMPPVIELVQKHLPFFLSLLTKPPTPTELKTQYGSLNPPFGETRMKAVELLLVLFRSNYPKINEELARLRAIPPVMECFLAYPWNNMLHGLVESILRTVMEGDSEPLKKAMFAESKLIDTFIRGYQLNLEAQARTKGNRLGFVGHLLRICNAVHIAIDKDPQIRSFVSDEDMKKWEDFCNDHLAAENERQQTVLGGHRPAPPQRPGEGMEGDGYLEGQDGDSHYSFDHGPDGHDDDDDDDDDGFHLPNLGYPGSSPSDFGAPQHDDDDDDDWTQQVFAAAAGRSHPGSGASSSPYFGEDSSDDDDDFNPRASSSAASSGPRDETPAVSSERVESSSEDEEEQEHEQEQEQEQSGEAEAEAEAEAEQQGRDEPAAAPAAAAAPTEAEERKSEEEDSPSEEAAAAAGEGESASGNDKGEAEGEAAAGPEESSGSGATVTATF